MNGKAAESVARQFDNLRSPHCFSKRLTCPSCVLPTITRWYLNGPREESLDAHCQSVDLVASQIYNMLLAPSSSIESLPSFCIVADLTIKSNTFFNFV